MVHRPIPRGRRCALAVRDGLLSLWCALTGSVRIEAITIAVDDLDFRMLLEPICRSICPAICQQIHHTAALQVDDNRAEFGALPPSPLIDTSDPDPGSFELGPDMLLETPQDRRMTRAHAQPCHQSRGGTPARAMTEQPDNLRQAVSLTRRRSCKSRKTFGEDLVITPLVPTAPAAHSHPDRNWCPLRGKIAKHA